MPRKRAATKTRGSRLLENLAEAAAGAAVREWPQIEVFTAGALAKARGAIKNLYGKDFASKATDALCETLQTVHSFGVEAVEARPMVLEFTAPSVSARQIAGLTRQLAGAGDAIAALGRIRRWARLQMSRDAFQEQVAGLKALLETRAKPVFAAGLAARSSPTVPSSVTERCWLNHSMRTFLDPRMLRDVAAEKTLKCLDLPRLLTADMNVTGPRLSAPAFRKKFKLTGEHITVAVIDTEVDIGHPALAGRVLQKVNYTKERWGSPAAHGTAVAGIIGSADKGFPGMVPGATIANYKVLCTNRALNGTDFDGSRALQQALEDGAQIANCSWGAGPAGNGTSREAVACNNAWDLGMVIVKSAGNQGALGASSLTSPADADGVIVVGATDREGTAVQSYSSRGPAGRKTRPHLVAPGGTDLAGMVSCLVGGGFGDVGNGTSFAAPHVSGLAALLLSQSPGLEPNEVRDRLVALCELLVAGDANVQGKGFASLARALTV